MTAKTIKTELVYYSIKTGLKADLLKALGEIPFSTWKVYMVYPGGTANPQGRKFRESLLRKLGIDLSKLTDDIVCSREVNLEVQNLFDNQWNTVEGFRLFNKVEFVRPNKGISEGYYLRQTPEMVAVLQGTAKCGYCGRQAPVGERDFCDNCISSPYLEVSNLHLLRMEPIEAPERRTGKTLKTPRGARPLSEEELAVVMPRYMEAQTKFREQQAAKLRAEVEAELSKAVELATIKRDGMIWILDAGIPTENLIFYPHTKTFCFGWRNPVSKEVRAELVEKLKQFPFDFEIK